jgi:hypothetical protein
MELEDEGAKSSKKITNSEKSFNKDLILTDDDDDEDNENNRFNKSDTKNKNKKNAIKEYREALSGIGSKSTTSSSGGHFSGKKQVDKVLITESEFKANEDWLINDIADRPDKKIMNKAFAGSRIGTTNGSNKRKHRVLDENSNDEYDNENESEKVNKIDNDSDDFELDYQFYRNNKSSSLSTSAYKKRILDADLIENDQSNTASTNFDFYSSNNDFYDSNNQQNDQYNRDSQGSISSTKNNSLSKFKGKYKSFKNAYPRLKSSRKTTITSIRHNLVGSFYIYIF